MIYLLSYIDGEYDGRCRRIVRCYRSDTKAAADCAKLNDILRAHNAHEDQQVAFEESKEAVAAALKPHDPGMNFVQYTGGAYYITPVELDECLP